MSRRDGRLTRYALAAVCFFFLKADGGCGQGPGGGRDRVDVVVTTPAELAALAETVDVTGDLLITGDGLGDVTLPRLETIGGAIAISDTGGTTRIALPALREVGYADYRDSRIEVERNLMLRELTIPALPSVSGIRIADNPALTTVDFASLIDIWGDLEIVRNPRLPSCAIAAFVAGLDTTPPVVTTVANDDTATCP